MKKTLLILFALLASGGLFSQIVMLNENMDSYAASSFLGVDNPTWFTTWSNLPGGGEDAQILTTFAHSGTKSASADLTGGQTDCVLKLGNKTTGRYEVKWWMYVETNKSAYYNIQHSETMGTEWAFEIYFRTNGDIHLYMGGNTVNGTYPKAAWFEVKHIIKLDVDSIYLYINGSLLSAWPYHWTNSSTTGLCQLGGADLFAGEESGSGETPGFFFDDVQVNQLGTLAPTIVTTAATAVTSNAATLNGTVNANIQSTTVTFEYGLTTAYGTVVPAVPGTVTGNTVTPVTANLTGLLPGNTYHFRVHGVNSVGTSNGLDMTFNTPPILPGVITTAATSIGSVTATLNGTINAGGASTNVTFDYGLTTAYGTTVPGVPAIVTGNTVTPVSANLTGLTLNTTYHYRVNGTNSVGTTNGSDLSFTTTSCPMPGAPGTITGPSTVCGNTTGNVYSVAPIANAVGYNWSVPAGASITTGANTNTITVTFGNTPGTISVYGTNTCGNGIASNLVITVNSAPVPTIAGQASMCVNSGFYNYTTESGMTNYTWTVSPGGSIMWGQGTNQVQVSWTGSGAQTVSVNYMGLSGCYASVPSSMAVAVTPLPGSAGTITGTATLCEGTAGVAYTVPAITGALTYVWSLPAGAVIVAGEWTNSIIVNFEPGSVSGNINVYGNNLCGNGAASPDFAVTVNPIPPAPVITTTVYVLSSNAPAGNQWYKDGSMIAGATSQTYTATVDGDYWDVVTLNSCVSDTSNHIPIVITGMNENMTGSISVYPNPNDGQFAVKISSLKSDLFNISVVNNNGLKIMELKNIVANGNLEKNIDLGNVPCGLYSVIIKNSKSIVVKKIVVNK